MKRIERFSVALLVAMLVAVCFLIGLDIQRKFVDKTAPAPLTNLRLEVVNQAPNVGVFEVSHCYVLFDENPAYNPDPTRVTNRKNGYYQYQYYLKGSGIQRGYGLQRGEKRFSLFNVSRWENERPECCGVVPILWGGGNGNV